jgi:hypothetical protein
VDGGCLDIPLTTDTDIDRGAAVLIREHGDGTAIEAALKTDALLARGALGGLATWWRIIQAIDELLSMERPKGAKTH